MADDPETGTMGTGTDGTVPAGESSPGRDGESGSGGGEPGGEPSVSTTRPGGSESSTGGAGGATGGDSGTGGTTTHPGGTTGTGTSGTTPQPGGVTGVTSGTTPQSDGAGGVTETGGGGDAGGGLEARSEVLLLDDAGAGDFNTYATKKTLTSGLLDIGLLMANAAQLKALVELGASRQSFYYPNVVLIAISITLQVVAGIVMLMLAGMDVTSERDKRRAHRLNDAIVSFIFLVTVVNLFITAFGMEMSGDLKMYFNSTGSIASN